MVLALALVLTRTSMINIDSTTSIDSTASSCSNTTTSDSTCLALRSFTQGQGPATTSPIIKLTSATTSPIIKLTSLM